MDNCNLEKTYIHKDHRSRLRERYIKKGIQALDDYEILELLLFYSIPRKNTNEIAHKLIDRFSTITSVFNADIKDLSAVEGVGETSATLIKFVYDVYAYMKQNDAKKVVYLKTSQDAGQYISNFFIHYQHEVLYAFFLNKGNKILGWELISEGAVAEMNVQVGDILRAALRYKTYNVILAHNHPGGNLSPSMSDRETTRLIGTMLQNIDMHLRDHFIISEHGYTSFSELGLL